MISMSPLDPKENDGAGCGSECYRAGVSQVQITNMSNEARSTSIKSTKSAEEQCISGCYGSAEQDSAKSAEVVAKKGCASGCCGDAANQDPTIRDENTAASAQCGSGDCINSTSLAVPGPAKEDPAEDDCTGGCYSTKAVSVAIEQSKADNCNDGCCGIMNEAPVENCNDGCYGSAKPEGVQKYIKTRTISADNCCDSKPSPCCNGMPLSQ